MSKELIGKIRDELSDGGVMVAPYWAELLKESAQTLESQAREIERLQLTCNDIDDQNDRIYAELAALKAQPDPWKASGADWCSSIHSNPDAMAWADFFVAVFPGQADKHELMFGWFANAMMAMHDHLKAQPSGVVLPERKTWNQVTGREGFIETEAHNACLDEVARLNSSPVSGGEPFKCDHAGCVSLGEHHPFCEYVKQSIGGDDAERAAFEAWLCEGYAADEDMFKKSHEGHYFYAKPANMWSAWQARAALSANHREQVLDVSAMARVLSDRQADSCNVDRDDQWKIYGQDFIDDVTAMIAAAPSAGSQKEQGE